MNVFTLKTRIILPLIMAGVVIFGIGIYFVSNLEKRQMEEVVVQEADSFRNHLQSMLHAKAAVMETSLRFIAQDKQLIAALRAGDRQALLKLSTSIYERLHREYGVTHFYFHDAQRINLLRVHKPENFGDPIDRYTALSAEKNAAMFSGIELGPLGTFTLRSVLPVFNDGKLAGYIELGQEIDNLIQESHLMFHVELFMLVQKQYLEKSEWETGMRMLNRLYSWDALPAAVLVSQSLQYAPIDVLEQAAAAQADSGIRIHPNIDLQGHDYWAGSFSVNDAAERPVATLVILYDMTQLIGQAKADMYVFTGIFTAIGLNILVLFYVILGRIEMQLAQSRQKILEEEEKFEKISASAQDAIICIDNSGNISFWNAAAETIFGYTQEEVLGKNLHELITPERFREAHLKAFPLFQETGQGALLGKTLELAAIRKDGAEFPIEIAFSATLIAEKWNAIGVLRDITERKKAQREIELALNIQRVLDSLLNISLPPLTLKEVLSKSLDEILSIPSFSFINKGCIFLVVEDEQNLALVAQRNLPDELLSSCALLPFGKCLCGKAAVTREVIFFNHINDQHEISHNGIQPHGHYCVPILLESQLLGVLNIYIEAGRVSDENEKIYLKMVTDTLAVIIERKQTEEKLQTLAHNDPLTGLPNRTLFYDRLEQGLSLSQRHRQEMAVMFLDLDHFKEINDTLGHDMGDELLKETATRLLGCVRKMDTVARMGGDEFTVIITEMKTPEDVEYVAKNILKALLEPFELNGTRCNVSSSIGIAIYPKHGRDVETLLKNADTAMYQAKIKRNTYCIYSNEL